MGRIGVDGTINEVTLVPGVTGNDPLPEFVQSAVDAVRQWAFTPTLLNGTPVSGQRDGSDFVQRQIGIMRVANDHATDERTV